MFFARKRVGFLITLTLIHSRKIHYKHVKLSTVKLAVDGKIYTQLMQRKLFNIPLRKSLLTTE